MADEWHIVNEGEARQNIISRLRQDILLLQGFKPPIIDGHQNSILGAIRHSFPNATFPLSAIHEFLSESNEGVSASSGFIAGIVSSLMKKDGASVWISPSRTIFPPALKLFGIEPHKIIFIDVRDVKKRLWAIEEVLKCDGISAVVGEINEISLTESRRLQLAVEQSGVTGFILRRNPKNLTTAFVTKWKISSIRSDTENELPGIGFSRWHVELLKVRNGRPGTWQMEWRAGRLKLVRNHILNTEQHQKKAG